MNKHKTYLVLFLILSMLAASFGCSALSPKPAALSEEDLASTADNILKSIDSGDYAGFKRDFGEEMLTAFPESEFTKVQEMLTGASGAYQSCGEPKLLNQQDFAIYRFPCQYEKEEVTVTLVIKIDGTKVDGIYFDSPNLRSGNNQ